MAYFGGANQDLGRRKEKPWVGAHADAKVQADRDRLQREMEAENEREAKFARDNFAGMMGRVKSTKAAEDDDINDEAAGRRRWELAAETAAYRKSEEERIKAENRERRNRLKATKSKVGARNTTFSKQMSDRKQKEAEVAALLEAIRERVQNGEARDESMHGLEKRLAKAQNWVCAPPTAESKMCVPHPLPQPPEASFLDVKTHPHRHLSLGAPALPLGPHGCSSMDGCTSPGERLAGSRTTRLRRASSSSATSSCPTRPPRACPNSPPTTSSRRWPSADGNTHLNPHLNPGPNPNLNSDPTPKPRSLSHSGCATNSCAPQLTHLDHPLAHVLDRPSRLHPR